MKIEVTMQKCDWRNGAITHSVHVEINAPDTSILTQEAAEIMVRAALNEIPEKL